MYSTYGMCGTWYAWYIWYMYGTYGMYGMVWYGMVWYVLGLCDNGKTYIYYDNALQNYLDNDRYHDKLIIGYYTYWIFVILKLLYVLTYLYVLCNIQWCPEIYYYHNNKIIIFITIMNLLSR